MVMELLKGQTLRDRSATGPLVIDELLQWSIEIVDALDAAHRKGVVHRDIKPVHIFIAERGQAKILDFGLAKLTAEHRLSAGASTLSEVLISKPGAAVVCAAE